MNRIKSLGLILVLILLSCKKEQTITYTDTKIYFSGITKTDVNGNLMSSPDTTDWRFDDTWTSLEDDLFPTKNLISNQKCTTSIYLYPNPFQDIFRIYLGQMPTTSRLAIRLVNKDFKVIMANDSITGSVSIMPSDISNYDTLRLYYKLIDSSNYEYKGHGDILIKK